MRTGGKAAGIATLCLDAAKGATPVLVARGAGVPQAMQVAAGLATVLGHCYPIYLRLRGGKGVATAAGAFAVLSPIAVGVAAVAFAVVLGVSRIVSASSCAAALALPVAAFARGESAVGLGAISVSAIVLWRHRDNLARIRSGTERRLGRPEADR
jgi:glycerol-3-phosphate acyltransferase PlsY